MKAIEKIVILGGGSAGWMTAAMLAKVFSKQLSITLIESPDIPTVGVGEATIPAIQTFNNVLGLDEHVFLKRTQGTYKLGIQFENWGQQGDSYQHAFGDIGRGLGITPFHHFWLKSSQEKTTQSLWEFSVNAIAANNNKFHPNPHIGKTPLAGLTYAYHFDAGKYAKLLQEFAIAQGVEYLSGTMESVKLGDNGLIKALELSDGQTIKGDFFIDCSGSSARLIEQALGVKYQSYQHWLFCDRAIAVQTKALKNTPPFTRSIAKDAGWQWQIPLQNRVGNGLVYSSQFMSAEQAEQQLLNSLETETITAPKHIKFTPGRREQQWFKNCLSIGLSSGFLEPLESTSLHLIQTSIARFIKLFPAHPDCELSAHAYNFQAKNEFEKIRDFIILHYAVNQKQQPFWQRCGTMTLPDSLQQRIALFKRTGTLSIQADELFSEVAWLQVLIGQGIRPQSYHPLARAISDSELDEFLSNIATIQQQYVTHLPTHEEYLQQFCSDTELTKGQI
ncbi:tryptophan halogenase family protein [Pseudoalteromonas sp. ASV78]|uniref:tryptophan halogenase family protein n=1 Tax=Pseudoalteromonas sp. ASV78 TaxID=3397851 RepID=UPI0039FBBD63